MPSMKAGMITVKLRYNGQGYVLAFCNSSWAVAIASESQCINYESGLSKLQSIIPNQIPYCTESSFGLGPAKLRKRSNLHLKNCYRCETETVVHHDHHKNRI